MFLLFYPFFRQVDIWRDTRWNKELLQIFFLHLIFVYSLQSKKWAVFFYISLELPEVNKFS